MFRHPSRSVPTLAIIFIFIGLLTIPAVAMYLMPEVENVPVDRLVTNLEALVAASPADARLKLNLARVHAMAFAKKAADLPTQKGRPNEGAWFGNQPANVPFGRVQAGRPDQQAEARAHLDKAIALYADVIAANQRVGPSPQMFDLIVRLGYAWCIDQSGDRPRAIAQYREVLERAWSFESAAISLGLGPPITPEAFSYLRPLLDPDKDAAELALWNQRASAISVKPRPVTPIAIPLREGMTIDDAIAPRARVRFDADGTGRARTWTWIGRDAGWLVYDQRGTRKITSALQWFGNVTFWMFWTNGYEPLRALDDNRIPAVAGVEDSVAVVRIRSAGRRAHRRDVQAWSDVRRWPRETDVGCDPARGAMNWLAPD